MRQFGKYVAETSAVSAHENVAFIDLQTQRRTIRDRLEGAINAVLDHGQFIMGPEVEMLEQRLTAFSGARHAIACSSGTDALLLALMATGIGRGDAVFVPSFTFASTAEVVALVGATPVFVDVDQVTFNMSVRSLTTSIQGARDAGLRPRVVIAVDLFGLPADYARLTPVAVAESLVILADAAQSFGASIGNKRVGAFGAMTATSFFPAKPLGCYGDGGALFSDDDETATLVQSLRVHGQGSAKYDTVRVGINGRLDTIQAAILLVKLDIFESELAERQIVSQRYTDGLRDVVQVPDVGQDRASAWAQYTIVTNARDMVARALQDQGIPTAVYYPKPLHEQLAYRDCPTDPRGLPISEFLAGRVLSLPMHPYLEQRVQERIIEVIRDVIART